MTDVYLEFRYSFFPNVPHEWVTDRATGIQRLLPKVADRESCKLHDRCLVDAKVLWGSDQIRVLARMLGHAAPALDAIRLYQIVCSTVGGPDGFLGVPEVNLIPDAKQVGRTVYRQTAERPDDTDELVGMVDTPELAQMVVDALNQQPAEVPKSVSPGGAQLDLGPRWVESHRGLPADYVCGPCGVYSRPSADCCGHHNSSHIYVPCTACQMEILLRQASSSTKEIHDRHAV